VAESTVNSALDQLQGVWESVAGPRQARLLIAAHRFTIEFIGGDVYMGAFDLVAGQMDMHIEAGPAEHIDRVAQCIYQIEGGVLRWCPGRPGSNRRPTRFPAVDDPPHVSLVFRRAGRPTRR
jgi:hypothetical protein